MSVFSNVWSLLPKPLSDTCHHNDAISEITFLNTLLALTSSRFANVLGKAFFPHVTFHLIRTPQTLLSRHLLMTSHLLFSHHHSPAQVPCNSISGTVVNVLSLNGPCTPSTQITLPFFFSLKKYKPSLGMLPHISFSVGPSKKGYKLHLFTVPNIYVSLNLLVTFVYHSLQKPPLNFSTLLRTHS